jgi:GNAT superfamily N-acetyltransferase
LPPRSLHQVPSFDVKEFQNHLRIPANPAEPDVLVMHRFLSEQADWACGLSRPVVEHAIDESLCLGGFVEQRQVAFERVVSDFATFAHLADVLVLPEYGGQGHGKAVIQVVMAHPQLHSLRRVIQSCHAGATAGSDRCFGCLRFKRGIPFATPQNAGHRSPRGPIIQLSLGSVGLGVRQRRAVRRNHDVVLQRPCQGNDRQTFASLVPRSSAYAGRDS